MTVSQSVPEQLVLRERRVCGECGKPSGSIGKGTGYPLVRDKVSGEWFHVRCMSGTLDAQWSCLERL